jgi:hypothetical protein
MRQTIIFSLNPAGDAIRGQCGGNVDRKPKRRGDDSRDRPENGQSDVPPGEPAFDNWLEKRLRTAYASVLDEPIPEDLIRLLSQKLKD